MRTVERGRVSSSAGSFESWAGVILLLALGAGRAAAQETTTLVSRSSSGALGNAASQRATISADGRFVAYVSAASNLVNRDTNGLDDVFVYDTWTGETARVDVDSRGQQANAPSVGDRPSISEDGRYVLFASSASNLSPGDNNGTIDLFLRDRKRGITGRVSLGLAGNELHGDSSSGVITPNGRWIAFESDAPDVWPGDTNSWEDVFFLDRSTGILACASLTPAGQVGNGQSLRPAISADGRWVAFTSTSSDLVPNDTNGVADTFLRDIATGQTWRVSVDSAGNEANGASNATRISISADGRYVAFLSTATNLVSGDANGVQDVFVHDHLTGRTERASTDANGVEANGMTGSCSLSADGRFVSFGCLASNLVPGDTNGSADVFVKDRLTGAVRRASVGDSGQEGNGPSQSTQISADGRFVVFQSLATNLVARDSNGSTDVFVHDLDARGFVSLCDPGTGGVQACPCSNPPSGPERGCDNSAGTGGASLSVSGLAYLSRDSLVFTTSGELPGALSILLQGDAPALGGIVYGQGLRCVGGNLKRLFVKTAAGGAITAPDFSAGDRTLSAESAAKGDAIAPGEIRGYVVYYRDPNVLGGCPAASTFNATQTGRVTWWF